MGGGVGMRNMVNQRKWILIAEDIGMGAAVFSITQLLLRIPILQNVLAYQSWFQVLPYASPILYGLFLAATAGLAEEPGRYLGFRLLGKKHWNWRDGIAFGLGHGGTEAVWVFVMLAEQIQAGASVSALGIAVAVLERISAVSFHVGASVMVLRGVKSGKKRWLFLAVILHTLLDLTAVWNISLWAKEALIFAAGAGFLVWAGKNRNKINQEEKRGNIYEKE